MHQALLKQVCFHWLTPDTIKALTKPLNGKLVSGMSGQAVEAAVAISYMATGEKFSVLNKYEK